MASFFAGWLSLANLRLTAERVLTSFWFTPLVMGIAGFLVAVAVVSYDADVADTDLPVLGWRIDRSTAETLLGTIAAATISAASVVYSLSLLIRNLAATTLGPRLVENFRKNKMTRLALGAQLAVFIYALTALFQIGVVDRLSAVSIVIAIAGIVGSLGLLVVFVNTIADQVSVDKIVGRISAELSDIIGRRLDRREDDETASDVPRAAPSAGAVVASDLSGYVQAIDYDAVAAAEVLKDCRVRFVVRPGDHVIPTQPLAEFDAAGIGDAEAAVIQRAILVGAARTLEQDPIAQFDLLVEVALRALSPGINDVFTAVACVHHLAAALAQLDGAPLTAPVRRGEFAEVRPKPTPFRELVDTVLNPLRHAGTPIPMMTDTMLDALETLIVLSRNPDARLLYLRHAQLIFEEALPQLGTVADRDNLQARFDRIEAAASRSRTGRGEMLVERQRDGGEPG